MWTHRIVPRHLQGRKSGFDGSSAPSKHMRQQRPSVSAIACLKNCTEKISARGFPSYCSVKNSLKVPTLTVPGAHKRTRQPRPSDSHPRSHEAVQCLSALRTHRRYRRSVRTSHTHIALIHICVGHGEHCDAPIYGPLLSNRLQAYLITTSLHTRDLFFSPPSLSPGTRPRPTSPPRHSISHVPPCHVAWSHSRPPDQLTIIRLLRAQVAVSRMYR